MVSNTLNIPVTYKIACECKTLTTLVTFKWPLASSCFQYMIGFLIKPGRRTSLCLNLKAVYRIARVKMYLFI